MTAPSAQRLAGHGRLVDRLEAVEDMTSRLAVDAFGAEQVLDPERHALERPALPGGEPPVRLGGHGERLLRRLEDIGVQPAAGLHRGKIGLAPVRSPRRPRR